MIRKKRAPILLLLLAMIIVFCIGCGDSIPGSFSEEEYNQCVKALDTIDGFLNADISAQDAADKLEVLSDQLSSSDNSKVSLISAYAGSAQYHIFSYGIIASKKDMDDIIECRDKIKEVLEQ